MIAFVTDARTGLTRAYVGGVEVANNPEAILTATRAAMVATPRQARLAMMATSHDGYPSLLTAVEAVIYSSGDDALIVSWEYADKWQRNDPAINAIGAALGLTDTDIDALFTRAMNI